MAMAATMFVSEESFSEARITIAGKAAIADRSGALFLQAERALVVSDLHLEKGSALAERGSFLPPYDTRTTLGRLAATIERLGAEVVVCLGDSLHDRRAAERLSEDDLDVILRLQEGRDWFWVTGNHDPEIPACLGGEVADELVIGGLTFRHEPRPGPHTREVAGHLHPAARVARSGQGFRRPCFVSNGQRLVMPAFGAFAGGLNVLDAAFGPYFGNDGLSVWLIGHEGVYPVAARQLRGE
jgi:hypothetical protein